MRKQAGMWHQGLRYIWFGPLYPTIQVFHPEPAKYMLRSSGMGANEIQRFVSEVLDGISGSKGVNYTGLLCTSISGPPTQFLEHCPFRV